MSEYIVEVEGQMPDAIYERELTEVVRCRDCKYGIDGGEYCAEDCADSWDWRCVEPNGFCAWGERANFATCECGEDIELGNCESAVCPRCNRTVRA